MDTRSFDDLTRRIGGAGRDRRGILKVAAAGLALLIAGSGGGVPDAEAARCGNEGSPCRRRGQCCSGRCQGPKGKKTCRARGAGTCKRGQDTCQTGPGNAPACNGRAGCSCFVTTGGSSFCSSGDGTCEPCRSDADCVAKGSPQGSACVRADRGFCGAECGQTGTACVAPCGFEPPVDDLDTDVERIGPGLRPVR